MAQKVWTEIRDDIEAILEDGTNTIFATGAIDTQIGLALREVSNYIPMRWDAWMTAYRLSREVDTTNLDTFIEANHAIYPVLLQDTDGSEIDDWRLDIYRRNVEESYGSLRLMLDTAPEVQATDTLTGTVTFTASSTAVTGSGTAFTSELRDGYYVKAGSTWHRVASVTDDTNLVLGTTVATADAGADTSVSYWRSDVVVNCDLVHYMTEQTDLAGAASAAHAKGSWILAVDGLGTGSMDKNILFTIAGVPGIYRITAAATITSNAATLYIEPALKAAVPNNAVVTFRPSSLSQKLERFVTEIAACRTAKNWIGDARTALDAASAFSASGDDYLNTITLSAGAIRDYLAYASDKLGYSNSLAGFSRYYRAMLFDTLDELKAEKRPKTYHTYSTATGRYSLGR